MISTTDYLFTVFEAIKSGISTDEIYEITKIDRWYLNKLKNLADFEAELQNGITEQMYIRGKKLGYTDSFLKSSEGSFPQAALPCIKWWIPAAPNLRHRLRIFIRHMMISASHAHLKKAESRSLWCSVPGPIRIGQGIEFDYSSVHCVRTLKEQGFDVVIVNNNPETVSTDYDTADRLYF